jgi:hypothetical protein
MPIPEVIRELHFRLMMGNEHLAVRLHRDRAEYHLHLPYTEVCGPCSESTLRGELTDPTPRLTEFKLECYKLEDRGWLWVGQCHRCGVIYFHATQIE